MSRVKAAITGVHGWVPEYILTNHELEKMVDTSDEWITTRTGIKKRHILKGEQLGTSHLGAKAVKGLLKKTNTLPSEIDLVICATITPDMLFPSTANIICDKVGIKNAFHFDINAACSGFIYALTIGAKFVESGTHKKVLVIGADKMSSMIDYTDRQTCVLFGDAAGVVMLEPTTENIGVIDSIHYSDGMGRKFLHLKAGGSERPASYSTIDAREHFIYQEGKSVYKFAVQNMTGVTQEIMEKHKLDVNNISWVVPHQANIRIINAVTDRLGIDPAKVMVNIQNYGNTTGATIPLCLWEWENKLKKNDKLVLTAFGGGFTWGAIYLKWAYDSKK